MVDLIGQKHLIRCRCILPQFKRHSNPPLHQFPVFSIIEDNEVQLSFVQCNNCGIVHKITDILISEIINNREDMKSLKTIEDIRLTLSEQLAAVLQANDADLSTWLAVEFIIENKRWGEHVVISRDTDSGISQGKYIRLLGEGLFKIETYMRDEFITKE